MSAEVLTSGDICRRYKISRQTLRNWRADPTFPRPLEPVQHGGSSPGGRWDAGQIAEWRTRKLRGRKHRRTLALDAYKRRAGETGHLSAVAHAYGVSVGTMRRWIRDAGLELPRDRAA